MRDQLLDTLYKAIDEALANVHTVTIARVTKVGATTINCKPVVARVVEGQTVQLPEFLDVPPVFMRGGASYMSFPIAVGDYALLLINERCYDEWYHGGDDQPPKDFRMHDYSDGFALVGIMPLSSAIPIPETTTIQGDLIVNGTIQVNGGDVIADTISLKTHIHDGDDLDGLTGMPVP